jgi:hypothetical protein
MLMKPPWYSYIHLAVREPCRNKENLKTVSDRVVEVLPSEAVSPALAR